jgi:hypothetical protein
LNPFLAEARGKQKQEAAGNFFDVAKVLLVQINYVELHQDKKY